MRIKLLLLVLSALLLAGCQEAGGEASSPVEPPPPPKTPQELLEEQPIDDTHNAFLVDTGGRMGTLLVTAEAVPYKETSELAVYQHVAVWDPAHMDQPLQTVDWEGGFPGEHQILDVNFDGYPDFTILFARGVQVEGYHCMVWDEEQGRFQELPAYADIPSPVLAPEKNAIYGWSRSSAAGDGWTPIYQWVDGELVCVRNIEVFIKDWGDPDSAMVVKVEDRVDGELTEVFREEYPLDPGEYFDVRIKWEDLDYHGEAE